MCPICVSGATVLAVSATTTGGVAALALNKIRRFITKIRRIQHDKHTN